MIADGDHGISSGKTVAQDVLPIKSLQRHPRRSVEDSPVRGDDERLSLKPRRFSDRGRVNEEVDGVDVDDIEIIDEAKP